MNKTPNYQLNQWAADDRVLRADFNADNAKIDAALKSLNQKADGRAQIVVGSYTGDGEASQAIRLNCTPKAVYVSCGGTAFYIVGGGRYYYGGLVVQGQTAKHIEEDLPLMSLSGSTLWVYYDPYKIIYLNYPNKQYQYIAFI